MMLTLSKIVADFDVLLFSNMWKF